MHTSWCRVMSHKNSQIIKKHVISFPFWSRKKCTIDSQESKLFRNDAQGLGERARLRDCPFFTVCPVRFSCERLPGRFVTSPVSKRLVVGAFVVWSFTACFEQIDANYLDCSLSFQTVVTYNIENLLDAIHSDEKWKFMRFFMPASWVLESELTKSEGFC